MNKHDAFRRYLIDEMSRFRNLNTLKDFIESLPAEDVQQVCERLSKWRNNSVYRTIAGAGTEWTEELVETDRIVVGRINATVEPLLARHEFRLHRISSDAEISRHPEFRPRPNEIDSQILIAKRVGGDFKLIDGNHRAIRLACDGTRTFTVLAPK